MSNPLISLIIATARPSVGALVDLETEHLFERTFNSLQQQTFDDFEVVIVDSIAGFRERPLEDELREMGPWLFPWKVIRNESQWLDRGMWSLQAAFNHGIRNSTGQHLLFCGDCCEFPSHVFDSCSDLLRAGVAPQLLCVYRRGGYLMYPNHGPRHPEFRDWEEAEAEGKWTNELNRDSRWQFMPSHEALTPDKCPYTWFAGYGFASREDVYAVNGFCEQYDGDKSLGDVEFGSRLQLAGRLKMYLRRDLYCIENYHYAIHEGAFRSRITAIRSNYDLMLLMRAYGIFRANDTILDPETCWRVIRAQVSGTQGWPAYPDDDTNSMVEMQRFWINNQQVFSL